MSNSTRRVAAAGVAALAIAYGAGSPFVDALAADRPTSRTAPPGSAVHGPVTVEMVYFADKRRAPVRLMRGARDLPAPIPAERTEIVGFGSSSAAQVTVVRGGPARPANPGGAMASVIPSNIEKVNFADPAQPAVTIVRGARLRELVSVDLFGPANGGELDRVAFAVDGIESRHGADLRMWRPELDGPQGPMQVSAKAAIDVGGGDRFDLRQNRQLGRAYLAQMFRRYGNWADALAAYNWGPGNLDQWIAGGRNPNQLPLETARYILRVMRDALILTDARL